MFTVYILYSEKVDQYYVGYTNDLERRISEHNRRKGKFTDRGIPWNIVYTEEYLNKEDAQNRECSFHFSSPKKKQIVSGHALLFPDHTQDSGVFLNNVVAPVITS